MSWARRIVTIIAAKVIAAITPGSANAQLDLSKPAKTGFNYMYGMM